VVVSICVEDARRYLQPSTSCSAPISSQKNSPWRRLPSRRPCMSVNATTTVSIAPDSTCPRSSSKLSTGAILFRSPSPLLTCHGAGGGNTRLSHVGDPWEGRMSTGPAPSHQSEDEQTLHKLGYAQELYRSMGGFQNFAISFTIISILAGCLTSYAIGFNQGGPVAITWGWLIVGLFCVFVSLAMGEIASTYPTAGGLYFWSSKLPGGTPGWGWFTGWFNLVGQVAVTASIGFGCAIFMTSLLNLLFDYPNTYHWIYLTYFFIMLGPGLLQMFQVSLTAARTAFA